MKLPEWFGKGATPGASSYGHSWEPALHLVPVKAKDACLWWITDGKSAFAFDPKQAPAGATRLAKKSGACLTAFINVARANSVAALGEQKFYATLVGATWIDDAYLALGRERGVTEWRDGGDAAVGFNADGAPVAVVMCILGGPTDWRHLMTPAQQLEVMRP